MGGQSKWVVIVPDGMYDYPHEGLGGRTPLEAAHTPGMDRVAREGAVGLLHTIPDGFTPGSDVAILTLLGCDVSRMYSGRAPLEAAAMGIDLGDREWAFRTNLVTVSDGILEDFSAGGIETAEARVLIEALNAEIADGSHVFYPGVGYRHIMKRAGAAPDVKTHAPHDVMGRELEDVWPTGGDAPEFIEWMRKSSGVLGKHPLNAERLARGAKPANMIWLWSGGPKPQVESFTERFGLRGACISGVDLIKGIGAVLGWRHIAVPGATGYLDTNYAGKGEAAVKALGETDFLFVHVEAPDEAGHAGDVEAKKEAIAKVDAHIVCPMLDAAAGIGSVRLAILGDHYTPVSIRTHREKPVPFAVWGDGVAARGTEAMSERLAENSKLIIKPGHLFLERFLDPAFWAADPSA